MGTRGPGAKTRKEDRPRGFRHTALTGGGAAPRSTRVRSRRRSKPNRGSQPLHVLNGAGRSRTAIPGEMPRYRFTVGIFISEHVKHATPEMSEHGRYFGIPTWIGEGRWPAVQPRRGS